MKEACGVVGVVAPGRDVAYACYDALYALQHRGQESAGMATFQNHQITVVKDNGLVSHVFADTTLRALAGSMVIGHTRYSTSGSANWTAAQPVYRSAGESGFALAHNGNLTNTVALAESAGLHLTTMLSDSDLVAELLGHAVLEGATLPEALHDVLRRAEGAFSMVVLEAGAIHAVRDPHGFRPLCVGRLGEPDAPEGWVVASETPALDVVGATFVREVMETDVFTVEPGRALDDLYRALPEGSFERRQRLYPVLDECGALAGLLPWSRVLAARLNGARRVSDVMVPPTAVAHPDEILRDVADRMAALGLGVLPVVDRSDPRHLDGLVTQFDLLDARQKLLEEERHAERVLTLRRVRDRNVPFELPASRGQE